MSVIKWFIALGVGFVGAFILPILWGVFTGILAALLAIIGLHIPASTFLAAGPIVTVVGFIAGVGVVMHR